MSEEMRVDLGGGREALRAVNYPPNSKKSKEVPPEKVVEQVTTGSVTQRKKGIRGRIGESLGAGTSGLMEFVIMDVILPSARDLLYDTFTQGLHRAMYGHSGPAKPGTSGSHTNYNKVRSAFVSPATREGVRRAQNVHEFDDIILSSRGEAEEVLDRLRDLISQYDAATVADLYDLVGLTGNFADNRWGWYDLKSASVRPIRGGYLLNLPRTQAID